ncbi:E3 ubiquitin-protein ligase SH3RF1-like [Diadema setosum]|uniref:E3 ubiquitin-protein ligase SH3RF1-like n=1 Tax=Diadema setosum TaxID=31175 RepID=UPI003B3A9EA0
MDEQSIFDILECSVCLERLDASSRVLPCQHTFCMRCLQQILHTRGELRCPECRELVPRQKVTDLPTNILLVRLLDGMKRPLGMSSSSSSSPSSGKGSGSSPGGSGGGSKTNGVGDSMGGGRIGVSKISGQSQACARALYNYDAQEPSDLSFSKGAIVTLLKRIDDNWYHGELDGGRGFFPASYVEVLTPLPPDPPQCKALYDFDVNEQEEKDCLTFLKDEVLNVIRRVDENWIEGQKGDKIGIFPLSFVELNETAKSLVEAHAGASGDSSRSAGGEGASGSGGDASQGTSSGHESSSSRNKSSTKRHSFTSMLGVQLRSKDSQEKGNSGSGGGGGSSPGNRHSMEISSPILVRSSNPAAATLIDAMASAASAMATAGQSPASSPSPSASPSPVAGAGLNPQAGSAGGGGRKKPAPLTLLNQTGPGVLPPHSPTVVGSGGPATPNMILTQDPPSSPKPKVEVFMAMYNFSPAHPDEVELRKGEFYTVTEKCKDGWFKGMSILTGQIGVFPGNYMQPYRSEKQKKTSASSTTSTSSASSSRQTTTTSNLVAASTAAAGQGNERKPTIGMPDGQKTVAQLQSERAQQQMQYRALQTAGQVAASRPIQTPAARLSERHPRGSPPSAVLQGGSASGSSWPGNAAPIQMANPNRAGQVHTAVQTSNAGQVGQTVRPRTSNVPASFHPVGAQLVPGSPPMVGNVRTQGVITAADGTIQPGVPVRQACSQMVPHQVVWHLSHPADPLHSVNAAPSKSKRQPNSGLSGGAMLATRQPVDKPRRFSESDQPAAGRAGPSGRQVTNHAAPQNAHVSKSGLHAQSPLSPLLHSTFSFSKHATLMSSDSVHAQVGADTGCRTPPPTLHHSPPQVRGHRRRSGSMPSQFTLAHKADKKEKKERKSKKPSTKHISNEAPELSTRSSQFQASNVRTSVSASQSPSSSKSSSPETQQQGPLGEASLTNVTGGEARAAGGSERPDASSAEQLPPQTTPLLRERYRVIVPYPPTTDAELELKVGDTVFVHKKREDGWFKGTLQRTGKTGLFPGSFAEKY